MMCDRIATGPHGIKPIYGKNIFNHIKYDTIFTSATHHMVENEFREQNFIADSVNMPVVQPEQYRYEVVKNIPAY